AHRARYASDAEGMRARAAALQEEIARLQDEVDQLLGDATTIESKLAGAGPLPEPIDVAAIRQRLDRVHEQNELFSRRERREQMVREAEEIEAEAEALTQQMQAREQAKQDAIANAKLPVPGVGFGDGVVLLNGVPFEQASDAEQLRASCAIAMAGNPTLRV